MLGFLTLLLLLALIFVVAYWYLKIPKNLPPGPPGFPFLGCAPFIKFGQEHLILEEWTKRYGNIVSFYMGKQLVVVLANLKSIEDALVTQAETFNGRPSLNTFAPSKLPPGHGILSAEGSQWEERRNFILNVFHEFGETRPVFEAKISEEVEDLLQAIGTKKVHAFDIQPFLNVAVSNVLCSIVFGQRFDDREVDFRAQVERMTQNISVSQVNFLSPINYFPILLKVPVISNRIKQLTHEGDEIIDFIKCLIKDTKIQFNPSEEANSYVHWFLRAKVHKTGKYFDSEQLLVSVFNLFVAGTETVSATLRWAIFFMAKHPGIQEKVFTEIIKNVGRDRMPCWRDRSWLSYCRACIMEIQRLANVMPMSLAHRAVFDTTVDGYHIPADTLVVPLLWSVLKDPEFFPNPEVFEPQRFLDADGSLIHNPAFVPFSVGQRACLGEALAEKELFLFFASLIQKFKFTFPRDRPEPQTKRVAGMVIHPAPFLVVARARKEEVTAKGNSSSKIINFVIHGQEE